MSTRHRRSEEISINLTPMIDVVFLLVIFFMVGTKFSESESRIDVNVPSVGQMQSLARVPDERVVEVSQDGAIALDGQAVTMEELAAMLQQQHASYPGLKVAVRGDGNSTFEQVMTVLHQVRMTGIETVGLAARVDTSGGMRR